MADDTHVLDVVIGVVRNDRVVGENRHLGLGLVAVILLIILNPGFDLAGRAAKLGAYPGRFQMEVIMTEARIIIVGCRVGSKGHRPEGFHTGEDALLIQFGIAIELQRQRDVRQ